jgi:hypothetical protein
LETRRGKITHSDHVRLFFFAKIGAKRSERSAPPDEKSGWLDGETLTNTLMGTAGRLCSFSLSRASVFFLRRMSTVQQTRSIKRYYGIYNKINYSPDISKHYIN